MTRSSRFIACWGNGQHGRLGHGLACASELFPRVVAGLVGQDVAAIATGGAHTAVVTGRRYARQSAPARRMRDAHVSVFARAQQSQVMAASGRLASITTVNWGTVNSNNM